MVKNVYYLPPKMVGFKIVVSVRILINQQNLGIVLIFAQECVCEK